MIVLNGEGKETLCPFDGDHHGKRGVSMNDICILVIVLVFSAVY